MARVPIDVIVVFQIYASAPPARNVRDAHQPRIRIRGRMIGVRSGQYLGSYEYGRDIEFPLIPASCVSGEPPRQCLLETFGDDATLLASAVGDALAVRLAAYLRSDGDPGLILPELPAPSPVVERKPVCDGLDDTPYVLKVKNVDAAGLNRLEEYLTSFACYQHHRVVFSVPPGETDYWYETRANPAHLMQNLRTTLESMNIQGTVSFTGGNVIIVENIPVAPSGVVQAPH